MRILCLEEGLEINTYPKTIETIFLINNDNSIDENFTFINMKVINNEILNNTINNILLNNNIKHIENGFLFYSSTYQISYCHFMTQTLPKLMDYL